MTADALCGCKYMKKCLAIGSASLLMLYVVSYLAASLNGRYEAGTIGPSHVKSWSWAPRGFHDGTSWKPKMTHFFAPLYILDKRCWHTDQAVVERPGR